MPSIRCRYCRIAKQTLMIEAVEPENEKPVVHARYILILAAAIIIPMFF